jgi:hypothetical protein
MAPLASVSSMTRSGREREMIDMINELSKLTGADEVARNVVRGPGAGSGAGNRRTRSIAGV